MHRETFVEAAFFVARNREPCDHPDGSGHGNTDQHANETEGRAKGRQGKDQPYRVQADRRPYKLRCKDVALDHLTDRENCANKPDRPPFAPELEHGEANRQCTTDERPHVRDKRQHPRDEASD